MCRNAAFTEDFFKKKKLKSKLIMIINIEIHLLKIKNKQTKTSQSLRRHFFFYLKVCLVQREL